MIPGGASGARERRLDAPRRDRAGATAGAGRLLSWRLVPVLPERVRVRPEQAQEP